MSRKEDEDFAQWLDTVLQEYPESDREAARNLLEKPVAREHFYRGAIRADDYYRRLNKLEEDRQELEAARDDIASWYLEESPKQEALIAERDALKKQLDELGAGGPPPAAGIPGFSVEDLAAIKAKAEKIEALDKIMPVVMVQMTKVLEDKLANGYDVDTAEVMRLSMQQGVDPYKAYEYLTADQRKKQYETAREEEKKKWIDEGRRQAITARNGSPDQLPNAGPTVLDILRRKDTPESTQQSRVNEVMQAFLEGGGLSDTGGLG
jgi:hypothetical protein